VQWGAKPGGQRSSVNLRAFARGQGWLKRLIPKSIRALLRPQPSHRKISYAQEGEDRILSALLGLEESDRRRGFYVDVGAHHPERYSNTFLFYIHGWNGINIDAMPGSMNVFCRERSRDINLQAAIADELKTLIFYEFNEPALNSFCRDAASLRNNYRGWKIVRERQIRTTRLSDVLERHLPQGKSIDFMSIDVEGLDLDVLRSNNWVKFRPAVVLVEDSEEALFGTNDNSKIRGYMLQQGYSFCCKTLLTTFFVDPNQVEDTPVGPRLRPARERVDEIVVL
jgi:FkbM family methyltransferase